MASLQLSEDNCIRCFKPLEEIAILMFHILLTRHPNKEKPSHQSIPNLPLSNPQLNVVLCAACKHLFE